MVWDTTRAFPPARACLFCYGLTGVTFLGDPSAGSGLPRGTMVYANMPIPLQVTFLSFDLSLVIRKPDFCICENNDPDQLHGNREADQRLCFCYIDSTIPLLSKSEISSL